MVIQAKPFGNITWRLNDVQRKMQLSAENQMKGRNPRIWKIEEREKSNLVFFYLYFLYDSK